MRCISTMPAFTLQSSSLVLHAYGLLDLIGLTYGLQQRYLLDASALPQKHDQQMGFSNQLPMDDLAVHQNLHTVSRNRLHQLQIGQTDKILRSSVAVHLQNVLQLVNLLHAFVGRPPCSMPCKPIGEHWLSVGLNSCAVTTGQCASTGVRCLQTF